ncbi:MAG: fatty-acid oxidation protein subunit alpha [Spirulina sp. DLM2.Bin59]|nr:MAG: fatty-acid oxidation protein subunit alpha [Spirulina sp. DLM2.Bin59]
MSVSTQGAIAHFCSFPPLRKSCSGVDGKGTLTYCCSSAKGILLAKDFFHEAVKNALVKAGWTISHDPLSISFGGVDMAIDLGAEQLIAAEKGQEAIAVEIKSFLAQSSAISEFHTALGQFMNYRRALQQWDRERVLWLAVPLEAYANFFRLEFPHLMVQEN